MHTDTTSSRSILHQPIFKHSHLERELVAGSVTVHSPKQLLKLHTHKPPLTITKATPSTWLGLHIKSGTKKTITILLLHAFGLKYIKTQMLICFCVSRLSFGKLRVGYKGCDFNGN